MSPAVIEGDGTDRAKGTLAPGTATAWLAAKEAARRARKASTVAADQRKQAQAVAAVRIQAAMRRSLACKRTAAIKSTGQLYKVVLAERFRAWLAERRQCSKPGYAGSFVDKRCAERERLRYPWVLEREAKVKGARMVRAHASSSCTKEPADFFLSSLKDPSLRRRPDGRHGHNIVYGRHSYILSGVPAGSAESFDGWKTPTVSSSDSISLAPSSPRGIE